MMLSESEQRVRCPFCGEAITLLIDVSAGQQSYIEDCSVCCQPIEVEVDAVDDELVAVSVHCGS